MPCGWKGNRRSGVALAMRHRLKWFIHQRAHGLDREMSTPPTLSCGIWPIYLFTRKSGDKVVGATSSEGFIGLNRQYVGGPPPRAIGPPAQRYASAVLAQRWIWVHFSSPNPTHQFMDPTHDANTRTQPTHHTPT